MNEWLKAGLVSGILVTYPPSILLPVPPCDSLSFQVESYSFYSLSNPSYSAQISLLLCVFTLSVFERVFSLRSVFQCTKFFLSFYFLIARDQGYLPERNRRREEEKDKATPLMGQSQGSIPSPPVLHSVRILGRQVSSVFQATKAGIPKHSLPCDIWLP